jgi:hypothetical protein
MHYIQSITGFLKYFLVNIKLNLVNYKPFFK